MTDLAVQFPEIKVEGLLDFVIIYSEIILPLSFPAVIHEDPSDDKFLECAVSGKASCIITGDKHLLKLLSFKGVSILKPRQFVENYLGGK